MSTFLHAEGVEWAASAGALTGTYRDLIAGENCEINAERQIIEHVLASNPNPTERIQVGNKFSAKFVLAAAAESDFDDLFGGSYASPTYTANQDVATLSEKTLKFKIQTTTAATYRYVQLTNMNLIGNLNMVFRNNHDGRWYCPVEAASTEDSAMTVTTS